MIQVKLPLCLAKRVTDLAKAHNPWQLYFTWKKKKSEIPGILNANVLQTGSVIDICIQNTKFL